MIHSCTISVHSLKTWTHLYRCNSLLCCIPDEAHDIHTLPLLLNIRHAVTASSVWAQQDSSGNEHLATRTTSDIINQVHVCVDTQKWLKGAQNEVVTSDMQQDNMRGTRYCIMHPLTMHTQIRMYHIVGASLSEPHIVYECHGEFPHLVGTTYPIIGSSCTIQTDRRIRQINQQCILRAHMRAHTHTNLHIHSPNTSILSPGCSICQEIICSCSLNW